MAILALQGSDAAASSSCSADPSLTWSFCRRRLCARQLKEDRRHCRDKNWNSHSAQAQHIGGTLGMFLKAAHSPST